MKVGEDDSRFEKILRCCEKAKADGYEHVWIDTCCIDQKSSVELSELINSMWSLYEHANT